MRSIVSLGLQLSSSAGRVSPPIYIAPGGCQQFDPEGPNYCGGVATGLYIYPDKITQQALLSILQAVSKFPANPLRTWFMQYYGSDSEPEDCPPERQRGLPNRGGNSWVDHVFGKQSTYCGENGRSKFDVDRGTIMGRAILMFTSGWMAGASLGSSKLLA